MSVLLHQRNVDLSFIRGWRLAKAVVLAGFIALAGANVAQAQSLILGVGYTNFAFDDAKDNPTFSFEYQQKPFRSFRNWEFGVGGALSVTTNGDSHFGLGLYAIYNIQDRWFVETSVMPGVYFDGSEGNWLGGYFQIRSLLAVGYALDNHNSMSLAITHMSNASTTDFNPGVNAMWLRWHHKF